MKKLALLSIALLCLGAFASAAATKPCNDGTNVNTFGIGCVFYGGDLDLNDPNQNGLANENDQVVSGNPYGAATFQTYQSTGGPIGGLFTNNLSTLNPASGYWEIRTGVSEGNGGSLVASGTATGANFSHLPTGRSDFGYTEYTDAVKVSANLAAGTYWFAVVPQDPNNAGRSFNSNANTHLNSVGIQEDGDQFFNSAFFGANYTNANNEGVFNNFSDGVLQGVPEPSSLIMLGSGLVAAAGVVRRRLL